MTQSKKIAVTGGIGSGKSTVAKILAESGYKVYSCDEIYTILLNQGLALKIGKIFDGVVDEKGNLDRKALSDMVFADPQKIKTLRELTNNEVINYALEHMDNDGGLTFCEVPLLFENGFETLFDGVIVVQRKLSQRIKSVLTRDNLSQDEIISRINSQFNYDKADFSKYYVIHNDGNLTDLRAITQQIVEKILQS